MKLVVKIFKEKEKDAHLVTPPIEEAHDRPLMVYLMMILLQSIQNSCHYFGELLEQKEEKYKTKC